MNIDSAFVIPPRLRARTVGEETVILDLESGKYFSLNSVGGRVWELIQSGKSLKQICDVLIEQYDASREVLERDVLALASDLVEKKLVSVA